MIRPKGVVDGKQVNIPVLLVIYELRDEEGSHTAELDLLRDV